MINEFILHFDGGMPKGTAQQKGERVIYKNGRPVIIHYKKKNVACARNVFVFKLKQYRPAEPSDKPIRLSVTLYFDVKDPRLWGKPKPTNPDNSNFIKEFEDSMTSVGFWRDDAQVFDLRVVKYYAENAAAVVRWEEVEP